MDNKNNNSSNRPFSTFDWSNIQDTHVNRPKDITSDMWTPISAGKPQAEQHPSGNLVDRQKSVKSGAKKSGAKKKKVPAGKKISSRTPQKKNAQIAGAARKKSARPAEKKIPSPQETARREAARKKRTQLERERERRAYENEKRQYEKASKSYNRERSRGSSREELSRKRAKKKRRSKSFYAVTITVGILIAAVTATLIYCFAVGSPIAVIEAKGKSVYSSDEIVSACGVVTGENIFTVSEKKVNSVLCKALPYIGSVKLKRSFPDKLTLSVTPTSEKYLIANKNGYICLDKDEKILSVKKRKTSEGVYRLDGFKGQSVRIGETYIPSKEDKERFESAKRVIAALEAASIKKANVIELEATDNIIVVYDSRINIYIGSADKAEDKLLLASKVIESSVTAGSKGYIDVRYESRAYFNEGKMEI